MKQLILGTTAYATFKSDVEQKRCSHAYMLHLNDVKNLRAVLKIFALKFFNLSENDVDGRRLLNENLPDCRIFPAEGKPLTADAVSELLSDSVLNPLEKENKLYIISGFEQASALLQNKLLKTLEEPPRGVYFILGVTTLAPVLDTVKSRVKTLTIPPFTPQEILAALNREGQNELNAEVAESCGGIFGAAENMIGGGWFAEVASAAREICSTNKLSRVGEVAIKYGDIKYKAELLSEIALLFHNALSEKTNGKPLGKIAQLWEIPALIYACECVDKACADLKFNAYFQGLLIDFMLKIIEENDKWLKLRA